ncbi:MAG: hypothetical protein ACI906_003506 [Candidatus Latescibacterota bacterium]
MTHLALALFILAWCQTPASAHPEHSHADSVEEVTMAAVVQNYHIRIAERDSSAYRLLAPAYVQAEMDGHSDPRRWRPSGTLPGRRSERSLYDGTAIVGYRNDVEVVHARSRGTGGLVVTHEVGSYLDGTWDTHNVWIMGRVDGAWRIGASLHDLPQDLLCFSGGTCISEVEPTLAK